MFNCYFASKVQKYQQSDPQLSTELRNKFTSIITSQKDSFSLRNRLYGGVLGSFDELFKEEILDLQGQNSLPRIC